MGRKTPEVLWTYRTTKRALTGEISFSLAYVTETIIPVDISMLTLLVEGVDRDQNDAQLRLILDQSEEKRQQAQIRIIIYEQQILATHHKVKIREFQAEDGLAARYSDYTIERSREVRPNWEGPYTIIARGGKRSYTLADQDGKILKK